MDYEGRLAISYYKEIGILNKEHNITLVQHIQNGVICVRKELSVYNKSVFQALMTTPIVGIPRIFALHEENEKLIVIEEYISGKTLTSLIDEHQLNDSLVQKFAIDLCDICTSLHSFNPAIIHRDINPSNIIITSSNNLYLIDLNIARPYREGLSADTTYLGTDGFAAPEQYGFGASSVQTDVYGIGTVLKAMLANINTNNANLHKVVDRATQIAPKDRYSTTEEMRKAIFNEYNPAGDDKNWRRFLPPGFRTANPLHILIAIPVYLMILAISLGVTAQDSNPDTQLFSTWYYRIAILIDNLATVFFAFNYCNIQKLFLWCQHRNIGIRIIAKIVWSCIIWFFLAVVLIILMIPFITILANN